MSDEDEWISFRCAGERLAPRAGSLMNARVWLWARLGNQFSEKIDFPLNNSGRPVSLSMSPIEYEVPLPRKLLAVAPLHPLLSSLEPASPKWFDTVSHLHRQGKLGADWEEFIWMDNWLNDSLLVSWPFIDSEFVATSRDSIGAKHPDSGGDLAGSKLQISPVFVRSQNLPGKRVDDGAPERLWADEDLAGFAELQVARGFNQSEAVKAAQSNWPDDRKRPPRDDLRAAFRTAM